jgi:hypothetical protein
LKCNKPASALIILRGAKGFGALPPRQNGFKYKGAKAIGALLELKGVIVLDVIYIIYSIYLIKNNYLYCFKIYTQFFLDRKV